MLLSFSYLMYCTLYEICEHDISNLTFCPSVREQLFCGTVPYEAIITINQKDFEVKMTVYNRT